MRLRFPINDFRESIGPQKIYFFSSRKISSDSPHYFICLKRTDNDVLILSCCTSQFETNLRIIRRNAWQEETLVWIKPGEGENPFTVDTYVNCNDTFLYTVDEFIAMYEAERLDYVGEVSDNHYRQILYGIQKSKKVEQEIKDMLPDPDTI